MKHIVICFLAVAVSISNVFAAETEHGHPSILDLKFNIINFIIYSFLIIKYVLPKLRSHFSETKEKVTAGLKASKLKLDAANDRLNQSQKQLDFLNSKLNEIELNTTRDLENFKERNTRETKEKMELLAIELSSRLQTEKLNFFKRLNNETAEKLISLSKEKVKKEQAVGQKLNELSIDLLGNP